MVNEASKTLARTCIGCRHLELTLLHGSIGSGIQAKRIRCKWGHRLLKDEDLVLNCHIYSDIDLELLQEHLYLHCPHYSPEDDPEGEYIKVTREGWACGGGEGYAMFWRTDCPDWEGDR